MNLRQWTSNKPELMATLNSDQIASIPTFDFKDEISQKTLGLAWNSKRTHLCLNGKIATLKNKKLKDNYLLSEINIIERERLIINYFKKFGLVRPPGMISYQKK